MVGGYLGRNVYFFFLTFGLANDGVPVSTGGAVFFFSGSAAGAVGAVGAVGALVFTWGLTLSLNFWYWAFLIRSISFSVDPTRTGS